MKKDKFSSAKKQDLELTIKDSDSDTVSESDNELEIGSINEKIQTKLTEKLEQD